MTYYIFVNKDNGKINGCGQCQRIDDNICNCEVTEELYEDFLKDVDKYMAIEKEIDVEIPDYETITEEYTVEVPDETAEDEEQTCHTETHTREIQQQTGLHTETKTIYEIVVNPNYEEIKQQKERERLNKLSLTKREVFLALYKDKGITPEQLRSFIPDTEGLIEFDYSERFYRGNPLIDAMGIQLGYSIEDLDYLFEHKKFSTVAE